MTTEEKAALLDKLVEIQARDMFKVKANKIMLFLYGDIYEYLYLGQCSPTFLEALQQMVSDYERMKNEIQIKD